MLVDTLGRKIEYLRISVTDRCDLRCTYCMPKGFSSFEEPANWLTFDEIERIVKTFARLGTHRFRLTGGEPLLRRDLISLVSRLSAIPNVNDLSLTTNGTRLATQALALKEAGLKRINLSLDSLRRECVTQITGKDVLSKVIESLMAAKNANFQQIKINMVPLIGVNQQDIEQMIAFCIEHGFILRLIEVMPMGVTGQQLNYLNLNELIEELREKYQLVETQQISGGGPARYWQHHDSQFSLGLITPMSQHFCATCNRVRLSADGTLYLCLGQEHRVELRPLLRNGCSDDELEQIIKQAIANKPKSHDFLTERSKIIRVMSMTGG